MFLIWKDEIVTGNINWQYAFEQANNSTGILGQPGYLATITDPQEHNFLLQNLDLLNYYYFLGASSKETPGNLYK